MIKLILSKEPDLNYSDRFGRTALHHAARAGNIEATKYILQTGGNSHGAVNINCQTIGGETPLIKAADSGNFEIVKMLCLSKADPHLRDVRGMTAMDYAVSTSEKELIDNLV